MNKKNFPIVVDLDGTLIFEEISWISFWRFLQKYPWKLFSLIKKSCHGSAVIKDYLANHIIIDPLTLAFNKKLVQHLKERKKQGCTLYLATGANQRYAEAISRHLGIFSQSFGSDEKTNLVSENKANLLNLLFNKKEYIYYGNSLQDIAVWENCAKGIAVNTSSTVKNKIEQLNLPVDFFK